MFKIGLKNVQVVLGDSNLELDLPFGVQTHQVEKEGIVLTIGKKNWTLQIRILLIRSVQIRILLIRSVQIRILLIRSVQIRILFIRSVQIV